MPRRLARRPWPNRSTSRYGAPRAENTPTLHGAAASFLWSSTDQTREGESAGGESAAAVPFIIKVKLEPAESVLSVTEVTLVEFLP
jgi:hypothetical protein